MDTENILTRMVQVGTVAAVDQGRKAARVKFQDTGIISDWLRPAGGGLPKVNDTVLVLYLPVDNGDGFILGVIGDA